jgi:nicotinamide phosphoribosyltransferase
MGAAYAMEYYNAEDVPAFSIPASEHSTMTTWGGKEGEVEAMRNMLNQFAKPGSLVACVSDSYDIYRAAREIWGGELKQQLLDSGATLVVRPDSGVPWEVVVDVTKILGEQFGYTVNEKGYKVLPPSIRVIQGDGVNYDSIERILYELTQAGWSADNVAFGMGGALLQQVNRDTQKFAMKASAIMVNGQWRDVFKDPVTDTVKKSKKGFLNLYKIDGEFKTIDTLSEDLGWRDTEVNVQNMMETVFENGKVVKEYTFDEVRENAKL